jgi:hypothetical protein
MTHNSVFTLRKYSDFLLEVIEKILEKLNRPITSNSVRELDSKIGQGN